VRWEQAPFDHPSLTIPNGHPKDEMSVRTDGKTVYAVDDTIIIPAVGSAGRSAKKLGPLQPFSAGLK
jgi:hypothetical protein